MIMTQPSLPDHLRLQKLIELWSRWNPLGHPKIEASHYESLAAMTLVTMNGQPSQDELVESLRYFISLESTKRVDLTESRIHDFAKQILSDRHLACPRKHYARSRER